MNSPVQRDAAIVQLDGRIIDVGDARGLSAAHRSAEHVDLGKSIILPGLVNAHVHLELSTCERGESPEGDFGDWIIGLRSRMKLTETNLEQVVTEGVRIGLEQCRRCGVTTIGDISQHCQITRPLLRDTTVRCVSYGEVLGLAKYRWRYDELLSRALDASLASNNLRIGLTPHAPYTVDLDGYRQSVQIARQRQLPLATHLAETPQEGAFLKDHSGMFRVTWERIGQWAAGVPTFDGGPIDFAQAVGLLEYPTLLAHVNYCDDREMELLASGRGSVVYCPRTHAYFGHPPHRWREMLARGINVAVGTDSCASSPDLNLLDDLRLLRRVAPEAPAEQLWQMATIRASRAIQMEQEVGSLSPGMRADLVVFESDGANPMESVLSEPRPPSEVWLGGHPILSS